MFWANSSYLPRLPQHGLGKVCWVKIKVFFKETVRYPIWTCRDPICLILGTQFSLILGTRFSILRTRFGSLKHLKRTLVKIQTFEFTVTCNDLAMLVISSKFSWLFKYKSFNVVFFNKFGNALEWFFHIAVWRTTSLIVIMSKILLTETQSNTENQNKVYICTSISEQSCCNGEFLRQEEWCSFQGSHRRLLQFISEPMIVWS